MARNPLGTMLFAALGLLGLAYYYRYSEPKLALGLAIPGVLALVWGVMSLMRMRRDLE